MEPVNNRFDFYDGVLVASLAIYFLIAPVLYVRTLDTLWAISLWAAGLGVCSWFLRQFWLAVFKIQTGEDE